jgi:hypothetical protein
MFAQSCLYFLIQFYFGDQLCFWGLKSYTFATRLYKQWPIMTNKLRFLILYVHSLQPGSTRCWPLHNSRKVGSYSTKENLLDGKSNVLILRRNLVRTLPSNSHPEFHHDLTQYLLLKYQKCTLKYKTTPFHILSHSPFLSDQFNISN